MTDLASNTMDIYIPRANSLRTVQFYFWLGIISAIFIRMVIIADHYSGLMSKAFFYLGVIGYFVFFAHRYRIATRRVGVLNDLELLRKVEERRPLNENDYEGLEYIVRSISLSKERLNYLVIIVFSLIAIFLSLTLDFGIIA
ncbi:MAG: hypothetical protein Q8J68_07250 [Methanolobus sp.]|uniref:hypothetical protein n=1 Tax=Methanolobus sp. TaxID=1874737 RepID=UPI0027308EB7|nr:hypothetical protein [Methanolobus sp.]MDP2217061.1 hypothetical protein [Methanolobus sp.]